MVYGGSTIKWYEGHGPIQNIESLSMSLPTYNTLEKCITKNISPKKNLFTKNASKLKVLKPARQLRASKDARHSCRNLLVIYIYDWWTAGMVEKENGGTTGVVVATVGGIWKRGGGHGERSNGSPAPEPWWLDEVVESASGNN
ncbi:hypothetical protein FXO38_18529 [Capsicum annuum]|nr:hypothetical protein FXO37_22054 [Capsicum annuum]KAF3647737.1 hypothetical protein FXO38_18529 [Capsicum annuum]